MFNQFKRNALKKTQLFLYKVTPNFLGVYIYKIIAAWVEFFPFENIRIWHRNSLYFKSLSPFISDIDFSIFQVPTDIEKATKQIAAIESLRKAIPIIGEVNYYTQDYTDYLSVLNYFEGQRDPFFREITPSSKGQFQLNNEKSIFILRMLYSDKHNLKRSPRDRIPKWRYIFKIAGLDFKTSCLQSLESFKSYLSDATDLPLEVLNKTVNDEILELPLETMFGFHTVHWIGDSLNKMIFEQRLENIAQYPLPFHDLACKNIEWEIWGLYTQRLNLDSQTIFPHIDNMNRVVGMLQIEETRKNLVSSRLMSLKNSIMDLYPAP